jgi:hypothetical protein
MGESLPLRRGVGRLCGVHAGHHLTSVTSGLGHKKSDPLGSPLRFGYAHLGFRVRASQQGRVHRHASRPGRSETRADP